MYVDPSGLSDVLAIGEVLVVADGPLPFGDILAAVIVVGGGVYELGKDVLEWIFGEDEPAPTYSPVPEKTTVKAQPNSEAVRLGRQIAGAVLMGDREDWLLNEDKDSRLTGTPGSINKEGNKETKIGEDGRAEKERHNTDHGTPNIHTNPHDHKITWDEDGHPVFGPHINYPNGAPEF